MSNQIVTVNVSITNPPAPSVLLRTGAFISQGATNITPGYTSPLTQYSDLAPLLKPGLAITSLTWSSSVVTAVTSAPHGYTIGETVSLTITGATPTQYNGTVNATITSTTGVTYPLASNPGLETVPGSVVVAEAAELIAMATTLFAQGSAVSVLVLELGEGTPADGVTALNTFIQNNLNTVFSYLVPREWDGEPTFKTMAANYNAPTALTKFFVTTTISTYSAWPALDSCVYAAVEAPGLAPTEFSLAATFYVTLNYNPSSSNQVSPLCFAFLFGVTAYPTFSNGPLLAALKAANVNYVGTAAEGGLTNTMVLWGHMLDGNPFNYWYTVAWHVINLNLDLSNEVINGSNNVLAPLYYNQQGINRLENRGAKTLRNGVSYGLTLGQVVVVALPASQFVANVVAGLYAGNAVINAEPFIDYGTENPNDYAIGKYAGMSAAITPARGFEQIIFNLNVTNFVG